MRKSTVIVIAGVLLAVVPAQGGPLMKSQVAASANWVVHSDYEQFNRSAIGRLFRAELVALGVEEKLVNFETVFSFHPLDDVRDVTVYGQGQEQEKAVVLIDGIFDTEKLVALVKMNPEHEEIKHGGITVHKWRQEAKPGGGPDQSPIVYGCLYTDQLIVISAGLDTVKQAVDILQGKAMSATDMVFSHAIPDAEGVFCQVMAYNVSETAGPQPKAAVLRQTHELGLAVGESQGKFFVDIGLTAESEQTAQAIKKVLDGIIAFVALAGDEQPKLAALAGKVQTSCTHSTVRAHLESDPESVIQLLKEQWQKKQTTEEK